MPDDNADPNFLSFRNENHDFADGFPCHFDLDFSWLNATVSMAVVGGGGGGGFLGGGGGAGAVQCFTPIIVSSTKLVIESIGTGGHGGYLQGATNGGNTRLHFVHRLHDDITTVSYFALGGGAGGEGGAHYGDMSCKGRDGNSIEGCTDSHDPDSSHWKCKKIMGSGGGGGGFVTFRNSSIAQGCAGGVGITNGGTSSGVEGALSRGGGGGGSGGPGMIGQYSSMDVSWLLGSAGDGGPGSTCIEILGAGGGGMGLLARDRDGRREARRERESSARRRERGGSAGRRRGELRGREWVHQAAFPDTKRLCGLGGSSIGGDANPKGHGMHGLAGTGSGGGGGTPGGKGGSGRVILHRHI